MLLRGSVLALEALQLVEREKRCMVGSSSPIPFESMFANAALLRIRHACCAWRPYCNVINKLYDIYNALYNIYDIYNIITRTE